ncbi:MAG: hypothetical protein C4519_19615 [Desulfobacteraceae bacterium]|nr:MAG: hypothetical protein C4519_19615 [Desulfobacteraceae bacterium]
MQTKGYIDMEITTKLKAQETARDLAYHMLAEAFRLPVPGYTAVLEKLRKALADLSSEACKEVECLLESCRNAPDTDALQVEYTRLFLGPFSAPAPPYGSVYLEQERRLMGDSTVDARKHYLTMGVDLSPDFKEAPDHICAELEFMHVLISMGLKAIEDSDYELLAENVRHQRSFLLHHLGAWLPTFANKVMEHSQAGFYRYLAAAAAKFVAEDMDGLAEIEDLE